MKFDGDPMKFSQFMRSFESSIGRSAVDHATKLDRLIDSCVGKAAKVVAPCVYMDPVTGYETALRLLEERYGNRYQISEAWITSITDGPQLKANDPRALQEFVDDLRSCAETLRAMDMLGEIDSRLRMSRIVKRLPSWLQSRWRKLVMDELDFTGRYPNILRLVQFLDKVAREVNDPVFGLNDNAPSTSSNKPGKTAHGRSTSFATNDKHHKNETKKLDSTKKSDRTERTDGTTTDCVQVEKNTCCVCGRDHKLSSCLTFINMPAQERFQVARDNKLCFNCLDGHHQSRYCKKTSCECGRKHSRLLHEASENYRRNRQSDAAEANETSCAVASKTETALPIVSVTVKANGRTVKTNALLDPGGTRTFCDISLVQELCLEQKKQMLNLDTLHGSQEVHGHEVSFEIKGNCRKAKPRYLDRVFAMKLPSLRNTVGDISQWKHLHGLALPMDEEVRLLVGQDNGHLMRPLEVRYGGDHAPYAVRTALGWMLNGPLGSVRPGIASKTALSAFVYSDFDLQLSRQVEKFWKVDMCGIIDSQQTWSVEDKQVAKMWDATTRLVDGHYEMDIPFKNRPPDLPDNFELARTRLVQLTRRLKRNPADFQAYNDEIQKLLSNGHAEKVVGASSCTWYLPHHCVNKPGKKFRVVFNCAAKFEQKSLNEVCHQGPDMTNNLLGVIMRFRENPVAVTGDIQSMFLQVRVKPESRDVLRFLWWDKDDDVEPKVYRMTSHLFGGTWSPSCASYALRRTAEDHKSEFHEQVIDAVYNSFYVDDCLLSTGTVEEAVNLVTHLCTLLAKGGFHLRKWASNSREVLSSVPAEDRGQTLKSLDLDDCHLPEGKTLGICWDMEKDSFGTQVNPHDIVLTKRGLLSTMSSVYDPLGILAPFLLVAKLIFQDECRLQKGWDESLEPSNEQGWLKWLNGLPVLVDLHINRCVMLPDCADVELHHFCDGSSKAYGAVTYLRATSPDGETKCSFMMAKSKLAPLKGMTIPRLELQAATLAVEMDAFLRRELKLPVGSSTFWTDSMIVIHYIRNTRKRFKTFVANRLSVIHEGTSPEQWRHVSSEMNPADDASRGLDAVQLLSSQRWVQGPDFLGQNKSTWPITDMSGSDIPDDDSEVKTEVKSHAVMIKNYCPVEEMSSHYSSWFRFRRGVAWLQRYIWWLKSRCKMKFDAYITTAELLEAERAIIKKVQLKSFKEEMQALSVGRRLPLKSPIHRLEPCLDEDGLLRISGRLQESPLTQAQKHPYIIPRDHCIAQLIIRHIHENTGHSGREYVLGTMRQKYWITKCRPLINQITASCVVCRKIRAEGMHQKMATLPADRVSPGEVPFSRVGIDCFGPFLVKRGRSQEKRYGCIFSCLAVRAIHIEKLDSLDTNSFINALVRFEARRGTPKLIRSDNGTNFTGAERELGRALDEMSKSSAVRSHCLRRGIYWKFNPPHASHMGGVWERQIRSIRRTLTAIVGAQVLDDERLSTLFCEVESIINGRPLTTVSDDTKDLAPLSPKDLLFVAKAPPLPGNFSKEDSFRRRWRHVQFLADRFWKRWTKEYLSSLAVRQKWKDEVEALKVDDVVLVMDDNLPRREWRLGRVMETIASHDGVVRSANVRTYTGLVNRPISKLCHLVKA